MRDHRWIMTRLVCLLLLLVPLPALAQTRPPTMQEAEALFQAQKWAEATQAYEAITKAEPSNVRAWSRLGMSLRSLGKYEQAIAAFQHAASVGSNPVVMYNLATLYSRMKDKERAFEWLRKALGAGFAQVKQLETDADLAALRDDPRFKEAVAAANRNLRPCAASPLHRQFDFWIGEWDVQNPQGQPAGTSSIQLILGDCTIFENWTSAGGAYTGKSFNLYNSSLKKWQQFWSDDKGGVLEFTGEYKDGELRYTGESLDQKGNRIIHHLTFFNLAPDRVRQLWEQSTDGGKTWTTAFDGLYVRKR
ncbi:MAG TPA: tetratricopeptide repeat protein [Pyrinomonadaceae bacterium]